MSRDLEKLVDGIIRHIEGVPDHVPIRNGVMDTPKRVVKSWKELYAGYHMNPKEILSRTFEHEELPGLDHEESVQVRDIQFYSMCEHHMLPFFGVVHIKYNPAGKVVGLSKLARLVECYARRLQLQERIARSIALDIIEHLGAKSVTVEIEATHTCMCARGVNKPGSLTISRIHIDSSKLPDAALSDDLNGVVERYRAKFQAGQHVWTHNGKLKFWGEHRSPDLCQEALDILEKEGAIFKAVRDMDPMMVYYHPANSDMYEPLTPRNA